MSEWQLIESARIPAGIVDLWVVDTGTGHGWRKTDCHWVGEGRNIGWFDEDGYPIEHPGPRITTVATHFMPVSGPPA